MDTIIFTCTLSVHERRFFGGVFQSLEPPANKPATPHINVYKNIEIVFFSVLGKHLIIINPDAIIEVERVSLEVYAAQ